MIETGGGGWKERGGGGGGTGGVVPDVNHQAGGLADGVQGQHRLISEVQAADVKHLEGQLRHQLPRRLRLCTALYHLLEGAGTC